jgi:hypothetical protein
MAFFYGFAAKVLEQTNIKVNLIFKNNLKYIYKIEKQCYYNLVYFLKCYGNRVDKKL